MVHTWFCAEVISLPAAESKTDPMASFPSFPKSFTIQGQRCNSSRCMLLYGIGYCLPWEQGKEWQDARCACVDCGVTIGSICQARWHAMQLLHVAGHVDILSGRPSSYPHCIAVLPGASHLIVMKMSVKDCFIELSGILLPLRACCPCLDSSASVQPSLIRSAIRATHCVAIGGIPVLSCLDLSSSASTLLASNCYAPGILSASHSGTLTCAVTCTSSKQGSYVAFTQVGFPFVLRSSGLQVVC